MTEYTYPLGNEWRAARERLAQLEAVWDPWTISNFSKLGVREGWHCLEVAGGGGSIAEWLCTKVGDSGHVVATDLQPHFLETIGAPNLEIWRHDILSEPLPEKTFDLIHSRSVLVFFPRPGEVIAKMAAALKPGGWLMVEEPDYVSAIPDPTMSPPAAALSQKGWTALLAELQSRGYDTGYGRRLYHELSTRGLVNLRSEGFVAMQLGGKPSAQFWKITVEQLEDRVLGAGLLTRTEFENYRNLLESPEYRWLSPLFMSAWGQRITSQ